MLHAKSFQQPILYYYDLYTPTNTDAAAPLLVCLHGYGQSKEVALRFGTSVRDDWPIIALQAPHPQLLSPRPGADVGFSWVSAYRPAEDVANHHGFIRHVVDEAFALGLTGRRAAFLFGFSQSVSLNYRFAAAYPDYVLGLIAVAGAAPSAWDGEHGDGVRLETPVLHIAPQADEVYPPDKVSRFRAVLEQRVNDLTWLELPGRHRVPSRSYPLIRTWLEAHA